MLNLCDNLKDLSVTNMQKKRKSLFHSNTQSTNDRLSIILDVSSFNLGIHDFKPKE